MIRLLRTLFTKQKINISRRKRISESLITEQTFINALMDNITDNIYFKDINSRFIRINKAMAIYLNLNDPSEAIGKTDFDYFTKEHAQKAFDDEKMIIQTNQSIKKEEKETWENRSDTWVSTVKMPLHNIKGDTIGTFGISRDITELVMAELTLKEKNEKIKAQNKKYRKLNEELRVLNMELSLARERAEKSDKLKSAFLQNISHEVRTPLNAVMGFSEILSRTFNNKTKLEEYTKIINQRCIDLLNIFNGILDIAKIESGHLPVYNDEFNLKDLFNELLISFRMYQKRIQKEYIELDFNIDCAPTELRIISDKTKLKQILINLVENAFKFTDEGKIQVNCVLNQGNEIKFLVSDTGIGIPIDKQDFIFERFTQIDDGYNRKYTGTGMGLSIIKGMIELLEGKIWLESEPGKGSTFYFILPVKTISNS